MITFDKTVEVMYSVMQGTTRNGNLVKGVNGKWNFSFYGTHFSQDDLDAIAHRLRILNEMGSACEELPECGH